MRARIIVGDCRASMATLPDDSVDAVVCDPPYHLTSIVDRFGKEGAAPSKVPEGGSGVYARASRGFMGQTWDGGDVAFQVETWREVWRVLKPGGHLLAFSGSRTYHRMACAIEDAGFEIRDQIMWVYGSGFPKSLDVSKAIDRAAGAEREGERLGAASCKWIENGDKCQGHTNGVLRPTFHTGKSDPVTDDARRWSGWGTALKPAHEPICMARKPLQGTVAANVLKHGTGAINVDGCRVGTNDALVRPAIERTDNSVLGVGLGVGTQTEPLGRWPANFIHDGSEQVLAHFPTTTSGGGNKSRRQPTGDQRCMGNYGAPEPDVRDVDHGSAARFFYTAKASGEDRDEMLGDVPRNVHPTVKPTDLMRYLVRMVTPLGGTVLDPFTGSGSTGRAAMLEGAQFIGCELSPEYAEIARARIRYTLGPLFAHEVE